MSPKRFQSWARPACALFLTFSISITLAHAAPARPLPKPEDPVDLPTDADEAKAIRDTRTASLERLKQDPNALSLDILVANAHDPKWRLDINNPQKDTDGDGVSDIEELLIHRNPVIAEPVYTREQRIEQIREGRRQAIKKLEAVEQNYQRELAAAKPHLHELIPPGKWSTEEAKKEAEDEPVALRLIAARAKADEASNDRAFNLIARKYGSLKERIRSDGSKDILCGEEGGRPVFITSHNVVGAAGISADELWPINSAAWPYSFAVANPGGAINTGLGLTGLGQTMSLWESSGGVLTTHTEFGGRVIQKDSAAIGSPHASNVAGTMAGGGVTTLFGLKAGRGVAYQANVFAY